MNTAYRVAIAAALSLGLVAVASAHPGEMGGAMGPGMMGGIGHGAMMSGQQLMTPEERQKIAEANRAEMEKRAKEKGITLPGPHGPGMGFGPGFQAQTHRPD